MTTQAKAGEALAEWRSNWTLVLSTMFGAGIATFHLQSVGPMIKPLGAAFGWGRAQVSGALLIVSVGALVMNSVVGYLMDRFGARRVALTGIFAFAATLALIGRTGPQLWTWYAVFVLVAVVSPTVTSLVWSKAIVDRFDRSRGLALGVMRSGLAFFGGAVPIFMVAASTAVGWRNAYALLGLVALVLSLPLAWFFFFDGHDVRRRAGPVAVDSAIVAPPLAGVLFSKAVRDSRFWRLAAALGLAALTTGFFSAHLIPMLTDGGLSPKTAALLTGAIGPTAAVAGLLYGGLADRLHAPRLTAFFFAIPIVGCLLILTAGKSIDVVRAAAVVITVGTALGSEGDSIALLVSRFFGRRSYGMISGVVMSVFILGFGVGPVIGGAVFDATATYKPMMYLTIGMLVASCLLVGTLGRYPAFGEPTPAARPE